ncbi:MAG: restriction endonuclease subunit S [Methanoregula sp.]
MQSNVPMVKLGDLLTLSKVPVTINPLSQYKQVTVRLFHKGLVLREEKTGQEIQSNQWLVKKDQFLISRIDARNGAMGIVPSELDGAVVTNDFLRYDIDTEQLDVKFFDFLTSTENFVLQCVRTSEGTTNRKRLQPDLFLEIKIPLLALEAQQQIVVTLERLMKKINEARKEKLVAISQTESILATTLLKAFHPIYDHEIFFSKSAEQLLLEQANKYKSSPSLIFNNAHPENPNIFEKGLYDLPQGWMWSDLGSVLIRFVDCVNDTPDFSLNTTEFIGLKSTNIKPYTIDLREQWYLTKDDFDRWNRREKPQAGDLILTREAPMGNVCILPNKFNFCLTQRLMLLRNDPDFIDSRYLLHYLNSPYFKNQVNEQCRGLTTPHLRVGDAPNIKIPIAPLEIQRRIVAHLDRLQAKVDEVKWLQAETEREIVALVPAVLAKAFGGAM